MLEDLIKQKSNDAEKISMDLVGWKKVSQKGKAFLRLVANPRKEKKPF